jgi:uncharacterized membrane protein
LLTEPVKSSGDAPGSNFAFNKSTIISLLYLAGFITGISGLVALTLAFVWRSEVAGSWEEGHMQYHITTGIGSIVASIVALVLMLVLIGFLLFPLIAIWMVARCVFAILRAQKQEAMPNPGTLLF